MELGLALGIDAASFFEAREKDIAESPTLLGNAQKIEILKQVQHKKKPCKKQGF
ncbi:hypothetical protein [Wocania ichthyoenteri]|uniref:hypothetical protein n=1 Tax=Wocania ichthyoenteri TaxID=1230531 RepID=UPI0012E05238|nr:hypothetical protein [Wocania ichthyoenteri]